MNLTLSELLSLKSFPSFITLFGEEDFLVYDSYNKLIRKYKSENPDSIVEVYDIEEVDNKQDFVELLERLATPTFFEQNKLLVFKNIEKFYGKEAKSKSKQMEIEDAISIDEADSSGKIGSESSNFTQGGKKVASKKDKKVSLEPYESIFQKMILTPPPNTNFLIITFETSLNGITKKIQNNKANLDSLRFPFNLLLKHYPWIEFPKMYENQIRVWFLQKLKEMQISFTPEALDFFFANTNLNLWDLTSELEKLSLYIGNKRNVTLDLLKEVIFGKKEANIFEINSLIAQKKLNDAIVFVNKILSDSKEALLLLNIIYKYFKSLLVLTQVLKETNDRKTISAEIGVNPFFLNDYLVGIKNYKIEDLEFSLQEIVKIDHKIKSSSKDIKYLFFTLLTKIMK